MSEAGPTSGRMSSGASNRKALLTSRETGPRIRISEERPSRRLLPAQQRVQSGSTTNLARKSGAMLKGRATVARARWQVNGASPTTQIHADRRTPAKTSVTLGTDRAQQQGQKDKDQTAS